MDLKAAAKRFVENCYTMFDPNRADSVNHFQEDSVPIFDSQKIKDKEAILAKLTSLPFQQCQHHVATLNCMPTGDIRLDGKQDALFFTLSCLSLC